MPDADPQLGDIYYYPYIWDRQAEGAEPEKDRPCCVALRLPVVVRGVDVYLLALSTSGYPNTGEGLLVPKSEVEHLKGFDRNEEYWLTTSEYNATVDTHDYFSSMEYRGSLSDAFIKNHVLPRIRDMIMMAFEKQKMGK